jgi:hypothetical protein
MPGVTIELGDSAAADAERFAGADLGRGASIIQVKTTSSP